ncbi:Rieske 2Fe-2S domain-containing protein [Mucilaginibacter sp. HMF5004]|uniref:QcrA and Rieske domain-containing protein n=1 Tax=Mucilaginibacter rivuli TaxID=2857527 RepID=UPI001C5E5F10|nr:Rieske 2Fe-2S domain-containing protein [Mucilaginibacter rivuli]MBW4891397.1 Rieske 2Fe-2S domain-containing protein [Mucilaginibacter rivuli]
MERQEFLSKFGIGVVAVCAGCALAACGGSKADNPSPGTGGGGGGTPAPTPGTGGGSAFLTADLTNELTAVGSIKTGNGIILVRLAAGNVASSFTAVQIACTHEGTSINYNAGQNKFICPLHGSEFNTNGNVILGPAAANLQHYTVTITGTSLAVS